MMILDNPLFFNNEKSNVKRKPKFEKKTQMFKAT